MDAAVFVLLGCREAVSPSMGSQCRLIGTMKVVNFLDGLGRTQMIIIYNSESTSLASLGRCGRTSASAQSQPVLFLKE